MAPTHYQPLSPVPAGWQPCSSSAQFVLCDPGKLLHLSGPLSPSALRGVGIPAGATVSGGVRGSDHTRMVQASRALIPTVPQLQAPLASWSPGGRATPCGGWHFGPQASQVGPGAAA